MYPGRQQPVAPGGRARAAGRASTSSTTTTRSRFPDRLAALHVFVARRISCRGVYNNAGFTQTFGDNGGVADEPEHRLLRAGRMESSARPDAERRAALRPAVPGDDRHRYEQRLAAARFRVVAVRVEATPWCAAAPDCSSTACRCARSRTRCCRPGIPPTSTTSGRSSISLSPTQAGAPVFPNILPRRRSVGHAGQPDDDGSGTSRMRIRGRPASKSSSSSATAARSASATSMCARLNLIMAINQNVPTCVASGTNNGCRPNPDYANNSQYSSVADSNYHGLHVSFVQRPARMGELPGQLYATRSR